MQAEIDAFYFQENMFRQKPIFAGKNYFCQSAFYHRKKQFFPPSGKNLPSLIIHNRRSVL